MSKMAFMTYLDISNIRYGKKKRRESNWQFDSRAQKFGNAGGVQHNIGKLSMRTTTLL
jgi:hypothetical protein